MAQLDSHFPCRWHEWHLLTQLCPKLEAKNGKCLAQHPTLLSSHWWLPQMHQWEAVLLFAVSLCWVFTVSPTQSYKNPVIYQSQFQNDNLRLRRDWLNLPLTLYPYVFPEFKNIFQVKKLLLWLKTLKGTLIVEKEIFLMKAIKTSKENYLLWSCMKRW
jgi:hypothetical protein